MFIYGERDQGRGSLHGDGPGLSKEPGRSETQSGIVRMIQRYYASSCCCNTEETLPAAKDSV